MDVSDTMRLKIEYCRCPYLYVISLHGASSTILQRYDEKIEDLSLFVQSFDLLSSVRDLSVQDLLHSVRLS